MRRLFSTILALVMLLTCVTAAGARETDTNTQSETAFLEKLGIFKAEPSGKPQENAEVTRAEFTDAVIRALGYTDDSLALYGDQIFWDVPGNHWAVRSVNAAYREGLTSGVGDNQFDPDSPIAYGQAVKLLVTALGWGPVAEAKGGYPGGYIRKANELGLLDGAASGDADAPLSRDTMALMIYHSLEAEYLEPSSVGEGTQTMTSSTLLRAKFQITKAYGVVTATPVTDLRGESALHDNEVAIDGKPYRTADGTAASLLGYQVVFYYRQEANDTPELVEIRNYKTKATVIDAADLLQFSDQKYTYQTDGSGRLTLQIESGTDLIYNGKSPERISDALYQPKSGKITALQYSGASVCSVLIIEEYTNLVVNSVNTAESVIYDKFDPALSLDLEPERNEFRYEIVNAQGEAADLNEIRPNMLLSVLRSEDGGYVKVIINSERVEGTVSQVNLEDGTVVIDETEYELSALYKISQQGRIAPGDTGSFYFGADGRIGWVSRQADSALAFGYLVGAVLSSGVDRQLTVKLFTADGEMKELGVKDPVRVDGESVKEPSSVLARLSDAAGVKQQVVRYSLDAAGRVSALELAAADTAGLDETKAQLRLDFDSGTTEMEYKSFAGTFAGKVNISDSTVIFMVPQEKGAADKAYSVVKKSYFINDKGYRTRSYVTQKDQVIADVLVVPKSDNEPVGDTAALALVAEFYTGLDAQGDVRPMMKVLNDGVEKSLILEDETLVRDLEVEVGDVIRFSLNSVNEVNLIELSYDRSEDRINNSESHQNRLYNAKFKLIKRGLYQKEGKVMVLAPVDKITNPSSEDLIRYTLVTMSKIYLFDTQTKQSSVATENDLTDFKHGGNDFSKLLIRTEYAQPRDIIIYR